MTPEAHPQMWLALGLGLAAAAGNVLGGLFIIYRDWSRQFLTYFVALGAGFMLAVSLLDIIPDSIQIGGDSAALFVLVGYFLVHFFEHTATHHFHFGEETHEEEMHVRHASFSALVGLAIHTFFDGVAIASGFLVSSWLGVVIFFAILLHKVPEGFTVASLLLAGGGTRGKALAGAALLGAATVAGVLLTGGLLRSSLAYTLPISGGVTLYVAASDLIPEVNRKHELRTSGLVFLGVALVFVVQKLLHI